MEQFKILHKTVKTMRELGMRVPTRTPSAISPTVLYLTRQSTHNHLIYYVSPSGVLIAVTTSMTHRCTYTPLKTIIFLKIQFFTVKWVIFSYFFWQFFPTKTLYGIFGRKKNSIISAFCGGNQAIIFCARDGTLQLDAVLVLFGKIWWRSYYGLKYSTNLPIILVLKVCIFCHKKTHLLHLKYPWRSLIYMIWLL